MVHRAIALGTVCAVAEEDSDALLSQHAPAEAAQSFLHKNARAWTLGHCRSYRVRSQGPPQCPSNINLTYPIW